jgi:hypothetical protein
MRLFRLVLLALASAQVVVVVALKGSSAQRQQLRRLQPAAPLPKQGGTDSKATPGADGVAPKEVAPKEVAPKEVAPKDPKAVDPKEPKVGGLPPKQKKCKKAPKVDLSAESAPAVSPNDAPDASPMVDHTQDADEPYCLQGDVTAEECSAAKNGKLPKGHQSIQGNVKISVSYVQGSSATDVLSKVQDVIRSETAAEFIGCDESARRQLVDDTVSGSSGSGSSEETPAQEPVEPLEEQDLRVTGVDFQKVKIADQGTCVCVSREQRERAVTRSFFFSRSHCSNSHSLFVVSL